MAELDTLMDQLLAGEAPSAEIPGRAEPLLAPALEIKPDEAAKKQKLSVDSGLPLEAVEADPEAVERKLLEDRMLQQLNTAPATKQFMTDPSNAEVAHDSVDNMVVAESYLGALGNAFSRAGNMVVQQGQQYLADVFAEMASTTKRSPITPQGVKDEMVPVLQAGAESAQLATGETAAKIAAIPRSEQSTRFMEAAQAGLDTGGVSGLASAMYADPLGALATALEISIESSPQAAVSAVAAAKGGVPGLLAGIATTSFLSERYLSPVEFLKKRGYDPADPTQVMTILRDKKLFEEAQQYGFERGLIIAAMDTASAGAVSKLGGRLITKVLAAQAIEGVSGPAGEAGAQLVTEGAITDPLGVALEGIAGLVSGPVEVSGVAIGKGSAAARVFIADQQAAKRAEEDLKTMDAAKKEIDASPLTQRSPDKAAAHVSTVLEGSGITEVGIPVDRLDEVLGADAEAWYAAAGIDPQQVQDARALGGDLRLTGEQFANHVMLSTEYEKLKLHIRFSEDGVTAAEAEEFKASGFEDELDRADPTDGEQDTLSPEDEFVIAREAVDLAEAEMGTQAMFKTAQEAGMTELEFKKQAILRAKAADAARKQQELKILAEKNRALSEQWKAEAAKLEPSVTESINQQPVYNAINSVQQIRLDRDEIVDLMADETFLDKLPKQGARRIYTAKGEAGMSAAELSEMFDFSSPEEMLWAMATAKPIKEAVAAEVNRQMEATHGTLKNDIQALESAIETLHSSEREDALMAELNAVTDALGEKRISAALLRASAADAMLRVPVRDLIGKGNKFLTTQSRRAKEAGKLWRQKAYPEAARAKFQQIQNFQMARQAIKVRDQFIKQKKYLDRFSNPKKKWEGTGVEYIEQIQGLLNEFYLGNPANPEQKQALLSFIAEKAEQGIQIDIPARFLALNTQPNYRDLSLADWTLMHDTVKALQQAGQRENAFIKADRNYTVSQQAAPIAAAVLNMRVDNDPQGWWAKFKKAGRTQRGLLVHVRTLLRQIDGWKDFGPAISAIRQPIVDAQTKGYLPGHIGYIARHKQERAKLNAIYSVFTTEEKRSLQKPMTVPGVRADRNMTFERVLSVLLNSGNQKNINALLESGQFTMEEILAVRDFASKRDLDFAQAIWDLNESFWPEREAAEIRRNNVRPVKEPLLPFTTKHGDYAGGYLTLAYERESARAYANVDYDSIGEAGNFFKNAAAPVDHTLTERTGSEGRNVALNIAVPSRHIDQVVYGLEMGDATIDVWKVLNQKDLKKAFADSGNWVAWEAISGWLRDQVTGEVISGADSEVRLRRLRSAWVFSKMAFNTAVGVFQVLGLAQSAQALGGGGPLASARGLKRLRAGVSIFAAADQTGDNSIYKIVADLDPRMAHRLDNWSSDILEIQTRMYESSLRKAVPAKGIEYYENLAFMLPKYMQRITDTITWLAAKKHGLELFDGDNTKASDYAYDTVVASQGSGLWMDHSLIQRGQLTPGAPQSQLIRTFSALISFFAARNSLAYETIARAGFEKGAANIVPNMGAVVGLAASTVLLYLIDGLMVGMFRGELPDGLDEDEEPAPEETPIYLAGLIAQGVGAGIPGVREVVSSVRGFEGQAGIIGSVLETIQKMTEQVSQVEWSKAFTEESEGFDRPLAKATVNTVAIGARIPATAINRFIELYARATDDNEENDPTVREWIIGPDYPEKK